MAITVRLLRSLVPALVCAGLALAACSSDSDDPPTDPPAEGGSDSDGGGKGGGTPAEVGGEAGAAPATGGTGGTGGTSGTGGTAGAAGEPDPGTGGTPTEPGTGGAGGSDDPGPTPEFLHGKEIYTGRCASCHQADLGGTGFYPNVSADTVNGIGSWTDEEIADAITKGADPDGGTLCAFMVPAADLGESELSDLIEYLRGETPSSRKITSACPL